MKMARAHYTLEIQPVVPADLATIYDLNPAFAAGYTGQGQTIAVLEDSDLYNTADWDTFRQVLGLSTYTAGSLSTINPAPPKGTSNCSDPGIDGRRRRSNARRRMGQRRRAGRSHRGGHLRRYQLRPGDS